MENLEKSLKAWLKREKWCPKSLDGKCDGYMRGLDGAKNQKCWFFICFTRTFWRVKGRRKELTERTGIRAGAFLGRFEVKTLWFLIENAVRLYTELCLLLKRGTHFQTNHDTFVEKSWKMWSDNEKSSQKRLDGKCDGYMRGADGAKKRKCWKTIGFTLTFWGSIGPRAPQEK